MVYFQSNDKAKPRHVQRSAAGYELPGIPFVKEGLRELGPGLGLFPVSFVIARSEATKQSQGVGHVGTRA